MGAYSVLHIAMELLEPVVGEKHATHRHRPSVISMLPQFIFPRFPQARIYQLTQMGGMNSWVSWSSIVWARDRTQAHRFKATSCVC